MRLGLFLGTLCALVVLSKAAPGAQNGQKIVCYFSSWSVYRQGPATITADLIEPGLCDVFIYSFVGLDAEKQSVAHLDPGLDATLLPQLRDKARASGTKFLVAMGGWGEGSYKYSQVIGNAGQRSRLVSSIVKFVEDNRLDGFDIDWEYPAQRGGAATDKNAFSAFVSELKDIFAQKGWILSAAVSANILSISDSYDIPLISKKLDFINLMTYDLHGTWEDRTGHHAPLHVRDSDFPYNTHLNIEAIVKGWIDRGVDPKVLYLGIPSYGRSFLLANPLQNLIGAFASGSPAAGWAGEVGFVGYDEICAKNNSFWTTAWDQQQQVPYAYSGRQWVGFDDSTSARLKTCLAKQSNLGGVMLWTIDTDDFRGACGKGTFPLLRTLAQALSDPTCGSNQNSEVSTTYLPTTTTLSTTASTTVQSDLDCSGTISSTLAPSTVTSTTSTKAPSDSNSNVGGIICEAVGQRIRDPNNCSEFWYCGPGVPSPIATKIVCPPGLVFDTISEVCNFSFLVKC